MKLIRISPLILASLMMCVPSPVANAEPRQSSDAVAAFSDELTSNPTTSHDFVNSTNVQCGRGVGCVQCPQAAETYSDANNPVGSRYYQCVAEYANGNTWHLVDSTVTPRQISADQNGSSTSTATIGFSRRWIRRWRPVRRSCFPGIPGNLSSNDGCLLPSLQQFFEIGARYHFQFERHIWVLGTGTGEWPDVYEFNCAWGHKT